MPIAAFLLGLITPLIRRALIALGIGLVTYAGVDFILSGIQSQVIASM